MCKHCTTSRRVCIIVQREIRIQLWLLAARHEVTTQSHKFTATSKLLLLWGILRKANITNSAHLLGRSAMPILYLSQRRPRKEICEARARVRRWRDCEADIFAHGAHKQRQCDWKLKLSHNSRALWCSVVLRASKSQYDLRPDLDLWLLRIYEGRKFLIANFTRSIIGRAS